MRSVKQYVTPLLFLGAILAVGVGCPSGPPNVAVALLVAPTSLDFGTTVGLLKFNVAKNYTSKPLTNVTITADKNWILPSPTTATSTGPTDPETITVIIDRTKLIAGVNTGTITVQAPGVVPKTVTVTAEAGLVANFTGTPTTVVTGHSVQFTDTSVSSGSVIDSRAWDFGDGGTNVGNNPTPAHIYAAAGQYSVSLTVTAGGLSNAITKNNYITVIPPAPPHADFVAATTTPLDGTPVLFTDTSTPGTSPITTWSWNFGDTGTSNDQNPTHTYSVAGVYRTVSLTVTTDVAPDQEIKVDYIYVTPNSPTAAFHAVPTNPHSGNGVQFTDDSLAGSGNITSWWWHFGDGITSTAQNPAHTYTIAAASRSYTVYLGVTNQFGKFDSEIKVNYITVTNP